MHVSELTRVYTKLAVSQKKLFTLSNVNKEHSKPSIKYCTQQQQRSNTQQHSLPSSTSKQTTYIYRFCVFIHSSDKIQ